MVLLAVDSESCSHSPTRTQINGWAWAHFRSVSKSMRADQLMVWDMDGRLVDVSAICDPCRIPLAFDYKKISNNQAPGADSTGGVVSAQSKSAHTMD